MSRCGAGTQVHFEIPSGVTAHKSVRSYSPSALGTGGVRQEAMPLPTHLPAAQLSHLRLCAPLEHSPVGRGGLALPPVDVGAAAGAARYLTRRPRQGVAHSQIIGCPGPEKK